MAKQLNYQDHKEALLEALQDSSAQSRVKFVAELKEKGITFPSNYDTGTEWLINLRQDADDHGEGKGWLSKTKGKEEGGKKQGATVQHKDNSGLSPQQATMIGAMAAMQEKTPADVEKAYKAFTEADPALSELKAELKRIQGEYETAERAAFFRFVGSQGQANVGQ